VILCNSDGDPDKEARYLDVLAEERVQGILIVPASADGGRRLQALRERGIAVVLLDRRATQASHCSVSVDDVAGGRLAVRHLLELGHRRIAFVGSGAVRQVKDRLRGATEAVVRAGCPRDQLIVVPVPALNVQGGRAAAAALAAIPASLRPTAAFCVNDLVALGLIQGTTRLGLAVPGELSVVGYDDIDFAESAVVPLSSVRQPRQELGRAAAELLAEEVSGGPHEHRRVVLQPELVVRASTAPLLGAAPGDTAKRARHQSEPGATLEGASAPCA
jgi:LacI family transcriptional regulator